MANGQNAENVIESSQQLTQVYVPIDKATAAFATRGADGTIPLVVIPEHSFRLKLDWIALGIVTLIIGAVGGSSLGNTLLISLAIIVGLLLVALGLYRSFRIFIPEGVKALLAQGGRYTRTIGSGPHLLRPWVAITHLISRREIPFDVPVLEAPTQDNVRANVDILITFSITDPYKFVFNISADDFDQVFQASCQDSLRAMVREITSDQVIDLVRTDLAELRRRLSDDVEPYGVTIMKIAVTYAQLPAEFMRSQEARQLAILQQAEQAEKQALALRRQHDEAELARQQVMAKVAQEKEELQIEVQRAEVRRKVVELEAEAEALRLARLEDRLKQHPLAVKWEWQGSQLAVAESLAGNTRAVVQMGEADPLVRTLLMRDFAGAATAPGDEASPDGSSIDVPEIDEPSS